VCIEFATSSRRLPTKIWKLNMLRIYPVELSRVVSAVCTHPSAVVTQFTILQPICDWRRKLETGSRLTTGALHRRHDATRLRCWQIVQTRRDCRQLVAIHTADASHATLTRQLSCVGGVYWALVFLLILRAKYVINLFV